MSTLEELLPPPPEEWSLGSGFLTEVMLTWSEDKLPTSWGCSSVGMGMVLLPAVDVGVPVLLPLPPPSPPLVRDTLSEEEGVLSPPPPLKKELLLLP